MPKIKMVLTPKTQNDENIDLNASAASGGGHRYDLIAPGTYPAILEQLQTLNAKEELFDTKSGNSILKLRPSIVLLNENSTTINRQDFKVGYFNVETQTLYSPNEGSVVWANIQGARNLLRALALFADLGDGKFSLDLNTDLVLNRVINVMMGVGGYIKGDYTHDDAIRDPRDLSETFSELLSGSKWLIEDVPELVEKWNARNGFPIDDGLQVKNVIITAFPMDEWDVAERGYFLVTEEIAEAVGAIAGQVFVDEGDFDHYIEQAALDGEEANW